MRTDDARAKPAARDGLVSRYLNRPLSRPLARLLVHTPATPNQVTLLSFVFALAAGWLLTLGHNVWGGLAVHVSSVIDGVDGDLARLTGRSSRFGAVFDAVLDRYADTALIGGATWWAYQHERWPAAVIVGLCALVGAYAVSYSRARIEASGGRTFLLGLGTRDVRLFVLALGLIAGQAWWALLVIAVVANATVITRLIALYHSENGE